MNTVFQAVTRLCASIEVPTSTEQLPILRIDVWSIVISLLNLLILFLLVKKFLFKPIKKVFDDRKKEVDKVYSEAEELKNEAEADRTFYLERKAKADEEAEEIVRSATERAKKNGEEIVKDARAEADAAKKKAEREIEQEKLKAVNDAKNEIASISVEIAEKIVEREINEADQKQFVDRFVNELKN